MDSHLGRSGTPCLPCLRHLAESEEEGGGGEGVEPSRSRWGLGMGCLHRSRLQVISCPFLN